MGQNMFQVTASASRKDPSTNSATTRSSDLDRNKSVVAVNEKPNPNLNGITVDIAITPPALITPNSFVPFPSSPTSSCWDSTSSTTSSPRSFRDYELDHELALDTDLFFDPQPTDEDWVECFVVRKEVLSCAVGRIISVEDLKMSVPMSGDVPVTPKHQ
ncbi:hypothetical protein BDN72DRAFT_895932 [Pluteus cervinus]|uniref:Uncharacterized protein n=1 Tax=Pluteus cervinus TaxID=181527 RepID=A0ACD3B0F9_9AGAR|nr:hypothetical protein BDN72DRAFT_895932 [Pluteus cervinus]